LLLWVSKLEAEVVFRVCQFTAVKVAPLASRPTRYRLVVLTRLPRSIFPNCISTLILTPLLMQLTRVGWVSNRASYSALSPSGIRQTT